MMSPHALPPLLRLLLQSNVGPVYVALAQGLISALLTDALVPLLNAILRAGLPIPALDGLALANTTIAFGSGYSLLATDVVHAPLAAP